MSHFTSHTSTSHAEEYRSTSPPLVNLLRSSKWNESLSRLRSHPQESKYISTNGETCLFAAFHDCTKHVPLPVLLGITSIQGNSQLISKKMRDCTILDSILLTLSDLVRMRKRIPDYEYRLRFQVICKVLEMDTRVIADDTLKYLFHFIKIWLDYGSMSNYSQMKFVFAVTDVILYVNQEKRMRLNGQQSFENFLNRLICIREQCEYPTEYLLIALEQFGTDGCIEYDKNGHTPIINVLESSCLFGKDAKTREKVLKKIISVCPNSSQLPLCKKSQLNRHAVYPLHIAIQKGIEYSNGLKLIMMDCTCALNYKDPSSMLFPFMQVASTKDAKVDTIYQLLLANPNVIVDL